MKAGWMAVLMLLAAPVSAQQWSAGQAGSGTGRPAHSMPVYDYRPIVGQREEMLWRECQRESARPQPTATAPKGGACEQLAASQERRNYADVRYNSAYGRMCHHDAHGNVLGC